MKKSKALHLVSLVAIILMGLLVMSMDYEDELKEHQYYCDSVAEGLHPDYKGIYHDQC